MSAASYFGLRLCLTVNLVQPTPWSVSERLVGTHVLSDEIQIPSGPKAAETPRSSVVICLKIGRI